MNRFFRLPIFLRGLAMGAADVVPGVSGGTIALITGIYEELLLSIKNLHPNLLKEWKDNGFASFWSKLNGSFLLSLFAGIAVSLLSLAKLFTYLLENYPILVWAFFFGLVAASAIYVGKQIKQWDWKHALLLVAGIVIAYYITILSPAEGSDSKLYLFICGAIAICAMILPGISGSLILLLLGAYAPIVGAIGNLDIMTLLPVALGAGIGLLLFSRVLSWLFNHYKTMTLALLTGFMIGALNKVWPWKEVLETYTDSHGETQPLLEKSILPSTYAQLTGEPSQLLAAIGFATLGFALVFIIEKIAE